MKKIAGAGLINQQNIDQDAMSIIKRLKQEGFEGYLVGGCVRDLLMGVKPKDFDVVTNALPGQIKRLFRRCFLIGRRFRLAHVYCHGSKFIEVATFRGKPELEQEVGSDSGPEMDEEIQHDQEDRFLQNNCFGTMAEDAVRRDFTVNALYYDPLKNVIIDYTGGFKDIRKKNLRVIGKPKERFEEDPVRLIRALRFAAKNGLRIGLAERAALKKAAPMVSEANVSRLLEELYKIIKSGASAKTFELLYDYRLIDYWFSEIKDPRWEGLLLRRLKIVDQFMVGRESHRLSSSVALVAVFYDYFWDGIWNEDSGKGSLTEEETTLFMDRFMATTLKIRLPKKERFKIMQIILKQLKLNSLPEPTSENSKRNRFSYRKFIQSDTFKPAFDFFCLNAGSGPQVERKMAFWRHKIEEHQQGGGEGSSPDQGQQFKNRPPRRRRRR